MTTEKRYENIMIWAGWTMIFVSPALYLYYESVVNNTSFDSFELFKTWKMLLPFVLIFSIHHYLLISLYDKRKYIIYALSILSIIGCYTWYQVVLHQDMPGKFDREMRDKRHWDNGMDKGHGGRWHDPHRGPHDGFHGHDFDMRHRHEKPHPPFAPHHERFEPKHLLLRAPVMGRIVIALLLMGMDLGVVSLNNNRRTRNRLLSLEKEKLAMELDYLKYQINPHFFMNTLNNIHALIDIDKDKAQRTIIDLSKLMRYVLYDSSEGMVSLEKEMQFIELYISLMKLRFSTKLDIEVNTPQDMNGITVPPLLFICFVENAFKHGVSNRHQSFINIYVTTDEGREKLSFLCVNSCHSQQKSDEHHGIGIENARKRLGLIYGDNHTLKIKENEDNTFEVWLQIPIAAQG